MSINNNIHQMTKFDKIIRIARTLEPGVIGETVKRLLLKAEYILEVAYTTEDDPTALASYHAPANSEVEPKEVPLAPPSPQARSKTRKATIAAKKDWGSRRRVTKPEQDRKDLVSLLKSYGIQRGITGPMIGILAKKQGFDFSRDDVMHWFKGDNLPGDYKFDQIMKFLEANDKAEKDEPKETVQ